MASESNPVVALSEQDKKEMADLQAVNVPKRMAFNKKVEKAMSDNAKLGKGFCNHCAMQEYEEERQLSRMRVQKSLMAGRSLKGGASSTEAEFVFSYNPDLSKYADRMRLQEQTISHKTSKLNPIPTPVYYNEFKCTTCGYGHSVEVAPPKEKAK